MTTQIFRFEWRPVLGCKGRYEVSRCGQIRRIPFIDAYGHRQQMKILSQSYGCKYAAVYVTIDQKKKGILVHRAMAQAFIPNPRNCPEVNHIDGNKRNNDLSNLEWVTTRENGLHARRMGLHRQKLTPEDVMAIRRLHVTNVNTRAVARQFGVTREQIQKIARGADWAWLKN